MLEWEIVKKKKNKHVYIQRDVLWINEVYGATAAAGAIAVQNVIMREIEDVRNGSVGQTHQQASMSMMMMMEVWMYAAVVVAAPQ